MRIHREIRYTPRTKTYKLWQMRHTHNQTRLLLINSNKQYAHLYQTPSCGRLVDSKQILLCHLLLNLTDFSYELVDLATQHAASNTVCSVPEVALLGAILGVGLQGCRSVEHNAWTGVVVVLGPCSGLVDAVGIGRRGKRTPIALHSVAELRFLGGEGGLRLATVAKHEWNLHQNKQVRRDLDKGSNHADTHKDKV
jgi:hypothetical protein